MKGLNSYQRLKNENIWLKNRVNEFCISIDDLKKMCGIDITGAYHFRLRIKKGEIMPKPLKLEEIIQKIKELPKL